MMGRITLLGVAFMVLLPACKAVAEKPRVVVMTDIGSAPDDRQSMVRFLLYTCDLDVEGLCTGFGHGHYETTRAELIREIVDAYGKVLPNDAVTVGIYDRYSDQAEENTTYTRRFSPLRLPSTICGDGPCP